YPTRDVHAEKRICEGGYGVHVGPHAQTAGWGDEVASTKRQNAVPLREPEVACDLVGIEPGRVHDIPGVDRTRGREHSPTAGASLVGRTRKELDARRARVPHQRGDDFGRIDGGGAGGEQRPLVGPRPRLEAPRVVEGEDLEL